VFGYDLMNEPFPGSPATASLQAMFARGAELLSELDGVPTSAEELSMRWLDEAGRAQILQRLQDVELYAQVIDVTQPIYAEFEQGKLAEMYQRVAAAIRENDPHKALLLETTMGSNMGVYSGIVPVMLEGEQAPWQVYAAHGYDLVVDTASIAQAAPGRVELIFGRHAETAQQLKMPMLVGEWGAYGRHENTLPAAWHVVRQFEKALCSDTYWAYEPGIEGFPCFQALQRPYPERVAGRLLAYHYDPDNAAFECTWREEGQITASSRIYLPDWFSWDERAVGLTPAGRGFDVATSRAGSESAYVIIPPTGEACDRRLVVRETHS
jgi:endoglycosylceramidase